MGNMFSGDKMEKICIAPGETGHFQNWNEDLFLEEKCFPEKFPYGTGGYLINDYGSNTSAQTFFLLLRESISTSYENSC